MKILLKRFEIMDGKFLSIIVLFLFVCNLSAQKSADDPTMDSRIVNEESVNRYELIEFAKNYLGTAYKYASLDPNKGFDCSGFVFYVFQQFNINLPRSSRQYKLLGNAKEPEEFKVGDVVVFLSFSDSTQIGHVGIICEADGMKSKFIHAASGKTSGITISDLDSNAYTRRFYKCIDVINEKS